MDLRASAGPGGPVREGFLPREGFLVVDLEEFQGPLDLLLHLIRQQDIDIFDIPIARITNQFLRAVEDIRVGDLDNAGEFLEMAASLVRIKAQMLLPRPEGDEELDPRAELVRRLLEYEQIREISARLSSAEAERARRFAKGWVEPRPRPSPSDTELETTWEDVFEAALEVELPIPEDRSHHIPTRPVAMEDKIELIMDALREKARVEFSRLLRGVDELEARLHAVMTFLASLELGRRRRVILRQVKPFSELWLYRREEAEEVDVPGTPAGAQGERGEGDDGEGDEERGTTGEGEDARGAAVAAETVGSPGS